MEIHSNAMLSPENLENAMNFVPNHQHQDLLWPQCLFTAEIPEKNAEYCNHAPEELAGGNGNGIEHDHLLPVLNHHYQEEPFMASMPLPSSQPSSSNVRVWNSNATTVSPPTPLPPVGFRFDPKPVELILHYLKNKIEGKALPCSLITEIPLYKEHPESIAANFEKCNDEEWFFFTSTERRYKNGGRPNRCAVGGYWKAMACEKTVKNGNKIIGYKKVLVFFEGASGKGKKTNWILHEYRLEGPNRNKKHANNMTLDEFVICKMYKKKGKSKKCQSDDYMEEEEVVASQEYDYHQDVVESPLINEFSSPSDIDIEGFIKELEDCL